MLTYIKRLAPVEADIKSAQINSIQTAETMRTGDGQQEYVIPTPCISQARQAAAGSGRQRQEGDKTVDADCSPQRVIEGRVPRCLATRGRRSTSQLWRQGGCRPYPGRSWLLTMNCVLRLLEALV